MRVRPRSDTAKTPKHDGSRPSVVRYRSRRSAKSAAHIPLSCSETTFLLKAGCRWRGLLRRCMHSLQQISLYPRLCYAAKPKARRAAAASLCIVSRGTEACSGNTGQSSRVLFE